jgi:hypothetical protein
MSSASAKSHNGSAPDVLSIEEAAERVSPEDLALLRYVAREREPRR